MILSQNSPLCPHLLLKWNLRFCFFRNNMFFGHNRRDACWLFLPWGTLSMGYSCFLRRWVFCLGFLSCSFLSGHYLRNLQVEGLKELIFYILVWKERSNLNCIAGVCFYFCKANGWVIFFQLNKDSNIFIGFWNINKKDCFLKNRLLCWNWGLRLIDYFLLSSWCQRQVRDLECFFF